MARIYENFDEYRHGKLVLKKCQPNCVEIFYIPSKEKLEQSGLDTDKAAEYSVKLLIINRFEAAGKYLNSISKLGRTAMRSVKVAITCNIFAQKIGKPEILVEIGKYPLRFS